MSFISESDMLETLLLKNSIVEVSIQCYLNTLRVRKYYKDLSLSRYTPSKKKVQVC